MRTVYSTLKDYPINFELASPRVGARWTSPSSRMRLGQGILYTVWVPTLMKVPGCLWGVCRVQDDEITIRRASGSPQCPVGWAWVRGSLFGLGWVT